MKKKIGELTLRDKFEMCVRTDSYCRYPNGTKCPLADVGCDGANTFNEKDLDKEIEVEGPCIHEWMNGAGMGVCVKCGTIDDA